MSEIYAISVKTIAGENTPVNFGIMPIATKTPACPVVIVPPNESNGALSFEKKDNGLIGRFTNEYSKLCGFVLTGDALPLKADLIREIT